MKETMTHTLTPNAVDLHEAARVLYLAFYNTLPQAERARIENMRGKLRVEVSLRVNEAAVEFVHEAADGTREDLGHLIVPPAPHDSGCDCVACEPQADPPGATVMARPAAMAAGGRVKK